MISAVVACMVFVLGVFFSYDGGDTDSNFTPSSSGMSLLYVGYDTGLAGETLDEWRDVDLSGLRWISSIYDLDEQTGMDSSWVVEFDSSWLADNMESTILIDFCDSMLPSCVSFVAVGNNTSVLFDVLREAQSSLLLHDDNLWYDDPTVAGYRLTLHETPSGSEYFADNVFSANAADAGEVVYQIQRWTS